MANDICNSTPMVSIKKWTAVNKNNDLDTGFWNRCFFHIFFVKWLLYHLCNEEKMCNLNLFENLWTNFETKLCLQFFHYRFGCSSYFTFHVQSHSGHGIADFAERLKKRGWFHVQVRRHWLRWIRYVLHV